MNEIDPDLGSAPDTGSPPRPSAARKPPSVASRVLRTPLGRIASVIIGVAVGWGAVHVAENAWTSRHDNSPISASSLAPSGELTVSGHGVTLVFPPGWINVPTTPNELVKFLQDQTARLPSLRAALRNVVGNMQAVRNTAMLVYRVNASGKITGSTNLQVVPDTTPPSQLMPHLKGAVDYTLAPPGLTATEDAAASPEPL